MATEILMPKLGLTMQEGKIIRWFKKEGDRVEKSDILYELETEKLTFQVEANEAGILGKIVVPEGETVAVGTVVGYVVQPGEKLEGVVPKISPSDTKGDTVTASPTLSAPADRVMASKDIKISLLARRIAQGKGIDLSTVRGTGPEGRITKDDVLKAAEAAASTPAPPSPVSPKAPPQKSQEPEDKLVPLSGMRATIARRMSQSFREIPHFWLTIEVDTTELAKARAQLLPPIEKQNQERLSMTDLMIKIIAQALHERPEVNASFTEAGILFHRDVNVGIAVAIEGGLIVPVVRNADQKSLVELVKARADVVNRARGSKLLPDDITGGTFTLTNLGMLGIDSNHPIINPPEIAILSAGRIADKPVVSNGQIIIRPMMTLTLAIDHRALDGASGGGFLNRIKELVEQPLLFFLVS